jgi:hypothetical protein
MNIFGCDIFGLKDCISLSGSDFHEDDYCRDNFDSLVDAVLPEDQFGLVRTGEEAEAERVHTGLAWPPESKVSYEDSFYLRRVPISLAWKILVEAGDCSASWDMGKGMSYPVEKIIAKYIEQKIKEARAKIVSEELEHEFRAIIAIPDHLDEFGKEAILRSLPEGISEKTEFLWRPIAATLAWIDKCGNDISIQGPEDWVLVSYLGPDGIEFTPLRLRIKEVNGTKYIIPLRDRPAKPPGPTGIDWQASAIEKLCGVSRNDPGAFWQAFTDFPELWLAISQSSWDPEDLPKPWSKRDGWCLWMPDEAVSSKIWSMKVESSEILQGLLRKNYEKAQKLRRGAGSTWSCYLQEELLSALKNGPKGNLLGLIICGPLTPSKIPPWILESKDNLAQSGLIIGEQFDHKQPAQLWLDHSNESIILGTKIFGHRILLDEPTYLDTLPGLSIYARKNNNIEWIALIDQGEQEGGAPYKKSIKGKFGLSNNEVKLDVYLKKEDKGWRGDYSPFREGKINFKAVEHEKTAIDINIEMRPTKGIARIELIPRKIRLGRRSLEYSIMNPVEEKDLPKLKQAWPETIKVETSKDPMAFQDTKPCEDFIREKIDSEIYVEKLGNLKKWLTTRVGANIDGELKYLMKIDQDGKAGSRAGQEIIEIISSKLERDVREMISSRGLFNDRDVQQILTRGTWLWGASPQNMVEELERYFINHSGEQFDQRWTYLLEAASRCFSSPARYKILFGAIRSRINNSQVRIPFPIQSSRAIVKILQLRKDGQEGLDGGTAKIFVEAAIDNIKEQVDRDGFSKFRSHQKLWQAILLFFLLMRFRIIQDNFLEPDNFSDREQFNKVYKCLEKAFSLTGNEKFENIKNNIKEYQNKRGAPGIINTLVDLVESGVENTEESIPPETQAASNVNPIEEPTTLESETGSGITLDLEPELGELKQKLIEARADLEFENESWARELIENDIEHLEGEIDKIYNQN